METVSIQEIRFDFPRVKAALDRGEELVLTYRNKPLAKLTPVAGKPCTDPETDPALEFGLTPERLEPMFNHGIDLAIYG